jgi:hypothetical protein
MQKNTELSLQKPEGFSKGKADVVVVGGDVFRLVTLKWLKNLDSAKTKQKIVVNSE